MPLYQFQDITLLITHYNRSRSLERLLGAFKNLDVKFHDVIVSDDCSKAEHLDYVKSLQKEYGFQLLTTPINKGLANNINKGQDAVKTPYTLYVQEDFEPLAPFAAKLVDAFAIMEERPELDIARFYAYFNYPYLKDFKDGFSEMAFSIWKPGTKKFYAYSDHPHLRRSNFFERFGRYREGFKTERTEYFMMFSFLSNQGKGIFFNDFQTLFTPENSAAEPSTVKRNYWRTSQNPFVSFARYVYRHTRFNIDYVKLRLQSEF